MLEKLKKIKISKDIRGSLVALESNRQIPFAIKRSFFIYGTKRKYSRGYHAHYKTKQFLIAVKGSCKVTLDNGRVKKTYNLNKPSLGLFQDLLIWGTIHDFSLDCILLVFASHFYDRNDYITQYDTFVKLVNK